ncbi:ComEA family DNA-binding protein [Rhodococcus sp. BP-349]|uniref:ComEA family DNA-binding protein n=1 Tax=unclassified Rhodococcus (in: high G+C Gram-positive bacteria) TaxID=192944 RepID=UPI001C9B2149|nr:MULTISPECIES: ComEA family DNA-binding protein [unclassified Rhodococcus (in: high G+C Gram-positive bacteria)]MBY6540564.1 ComEA family DNA-binding protein [Rhodococcus sp. BP-363]MBY6545411.1 ComEA family DNA-binding protein [Rhodococcus sp. BP-369]MBY6564641.1 ComEA family DNA-binding protein [Rhodococcus sp. BP-370]MBY6578423.1 ComEA family DNA-binding protein [Rhodococcus sp. BP-364]MBY6587724.1 ComEA family DNA-binding protein [Rhodococcus sp. BP-358]
MAPEIAAPDTDEDARRLEVRRPVGVGRFRIDPGSRGVRALAVAAVLLVGAVGAVVMRDSPQVTAVPPLPPLVTESETPTPTMSAPESAGVVVSVLGAVIRPGLVTVPAESRIADVVAAAGGRRDDADLFGLNWAAKVSDGDQVVVGSTTGSVPLAPASVSVAGEGSGDSGQAGGRSGDSGKAAGLVSLNEATEAELDALPGVGPVTASAIVQWRTENGGFTSVDQLSEVSGVGPARLEKLTPLVTL